MSDLSAQRRHTVLITGASSGIGYTTAALAKARGHRVIATAISAQMLDALPTEADMKVVIDICDQASIDRALVQIVAEDLTPTCLINNAGYAQPGPIELVDDARWRRQFEVNVFGTLSMTRSALPLLRYQVACGRAVNIVTLSSLLGLVTLPFQGAYAASKHALEAIFGALRMELRAANIDVSLVEPGWIMTQFLKTAMVHTPPEWLEHPYYGGPLSRYFGESREAESPNPQGNAKIAAKLAGTADQVAQTVVRAMEARKPKARYPVTAMAKWMPKLAATLPTAKWDAAQADRYWQHKPR